MKTLGMFAPYTIRCGFKASQYHFERSMPCRSAFLFSYSLSLPSTITSVALCGPQTHLVGLMESATWNSSLVNLNSFPISLRLALTAKRQLPWWKEVLKLQGARSCARSRCLNNTHAPSESEGSHISKDIKGQNQLFGNDNIRNGFSNQSLKQSQGINTGNACLIWDSGKSVSREHILTLNCTNAVYAPWFAWCLSCVKTMCHIMYHFASVHPLCKKATQGWQFHPPFSTPQGQQANPPQVCNPRYAG